MRQWEPPSALLPPKPPSSHAAQPHPHSPCTPGPLSIYDPRPLKSTGRHNIFLNSTCDMELIYVRYGFKKDSDVGQGHFLNATWASISDRNMRHWHFFKSTDDMGIYRLGPPICPRAVFRPCPPGVNRPPAPRAEVVKRAGRAARRPLGPARTCSTSLGCRRRGRRSLWPTAIC